MIREYCDRCGKEIPVVNAVEDREKRTFDISYRGNFNRCVGANFTLCKDCIEETGIKEAIEKTEGGQKEEKPKDAVEQLTDLIKEILYNSLDAGRQI